MVPFDTATIEGQSSMLRRLTFAFVAATLLALVPRDAQSQSVSLTVRITPYLEAEVLPQAISVDLDSATVLGADPRGVETPFRIRANIPYRVDVVYDTWQAEPSGPAYAAFSNGTDVLAGTLSLWGASTPANARALRHHPGSLLGEGSPGVAEWRIRAIAHHQMSTSPTGSARPGNYDLELEITLTPR